MKTFLVTAAAILSFNASAFAEDLHYGFPCGIGMDFDVARATTLASGNLTKTIEDYKAKLAKDKFEVVSVAATAVSFNKEALTSTICATVSFKEKRANALEANK